MSQVTCDSCYEQIDESKWKEHIISTHHVLKCKIYESIIATKFFEMIFEARPKKKKIFNLKNEKSLKFWRLNFSTKLPKERFDIICIDSMNNSEIEKSLSNDFDDFVINIISIDYFDSMKNITFCKVCSIEINKPLLYEHINSKEHKEIEKYLIINCMTYCEVCKKDIRNDEWREHIISENHLEIEEKNYCKVCKEKYYVSEYGGNYSTFQDKCRITEINRNLSGTHKENQERFDSYSR